MEATPSPGLAVSGLMQQLKSGEISKMQLFQQLAKLQAASAGSSSGVMQPSSATTNIHQPAPATSGGFQAPASSTAQPLGLGTAPTLSFFGSSQKSFTPHSSGFSSALAPPPAPEPFSFSPAIAPMPFPGQTMAASAAAAAVSSSSSLSTVQETQGCFYPSGLTKPGATKVENDAAFLTTGVSHEKAPRFSVQEWMATKTRSSASSQVSQALRQHYQQYAPPVESSVEVPLYDDPYKRQDGLSSEASSTSGYENATYPTSQHQKALDTDEVLSGLGREEVESFGRGQADSTRHSYTYTPHRHQLAEQSQYSRDSFDLSHSDTGEGENYIDFAEHFRDEMDNGRGIGQRGGNSSSKGGKNMNGGNANVSGGGINNSDGKFHARVTRWKSQKDAIREQMKQQLLQSELNECTFAPKINPKSTKVAAKLRGRQPNDATGHAQSTSLAVSERLYQEADNYRVREELAAKLKAEEEAEIERECTFKPKINRGEAKAKYLETSATVSPSLTAASREASAKELAECTFYPKVNEISAEMVSAQLYLQQDIYERLSKPCCTGSETSDSPARVRGGRRRSLSLFGDDDDLDGESLDMSSPRSIQSQDDLCVRPGGSGRRRRASRATTGQRPLSAGGRQTQDDREERARQFKNFLERQKFHEQARSKRIEMAKQQLTHGHKPVINKKSLLMMENGRKGDFLERISTYALRKEHGDVRKKMDPNCTFKPSINQTSVRRKARSITELSRGDLLRRETTQRLMKLKMEQEEMASLTFRPQLNRMSERHEGKLKILSSPDTYLQRIQQQSQAHSIKQRRAMQEKELGEFAECTFKPRTIEAPAYVQRIARSVSLTKALREQQRAATRAAEKPEWK